VFRNTPPVVAGAFRDALVRVAGFERVVFAVLDRRGDGPTYRAFVDAFRADARWSGRLGIVAPDR
jgi:hypothetical protein